MATVDQEPSDETKGRIDESEEICRSFLFGLQFIVMNTCRDPGYIDRHLLSYLSQDYLQTVIAIPLLVREGIHNVCRRETRFVLEMSIKLCAVQQKRYEAEVGVKLNEFKSLINSTNISMQRDVDLHLLPGATQPDFRGEVGRIYGAASKYVHLSQTQILERVSLVNSGRTSGKEGPSEVVELNRHIARTFACSLVFILHSVPDYVAGDLLVRPDGSSTDWFFAGSKFLASIDEHFDYKDERQENLEAIRKVRAAKVTF